MLESPRAIENAEEIAAVPGVDVLLIGTSDLCAEMGILASRRLARRGRLSPRHRRLPRHGKHPGMAACTIRRTWKNMSAWACASSWAARTCRC